MKVLKKITFQFVMYVLPEDGYITFHNFNSDKTFYNRIIFRNSPLYSLKIIRQFKKCLLQHIYRTFFYKLEIYTLLFGIVFSILQEKHLRSQNNDLFQQRQQRQLMAFKIKRYSCYSKILKSPVIHYFKFSHSYNKCFDFNLSEQ